MSYAQNDGHENQKSKTHSYTTTAMSDAVARSQSNPYSFPKTVLSSNAHAETNMNIVNATSQNINTRESMQQMDSRQALQQVQHQPTNESQYLLQTELNLKRNQQQHMIALTAQLDIVG